MKNNTSSRRKFITNSSLALSASFISLASCSDKKSENKINSPNINFNKNYKDLPKTLPLFPLSKVLLLPRAKLPLNLFENRYLHMFDHALANGRCIGMIQPTQRSGSPVNKKNPDLYSIGCAGYITAFSQTNDNRYEIILKGLCRFEISKEQPLKNGFRSANVSWRSFKDDFERENSFGSKSLLKANLLSINHNFTHSINYL